METKYKDATEHVVIYFDEADKLLEKGGYDDRILNEMLNIISNSNEGPTKITP
jgi:hypothetical protein